MHPHPTLFLSRRRLHPRPPTFNPRPPSGREHDSTARNIARCAVVLSSLSWRPRPHPPFRPRPPFRRHPLRVAIAITIAAVLSISPSPSPPSHDDDDMITAPSQLSRRRCRRLRLGRLSPPSSLPSSPRLASPSHLVTSDDSLDATRSSGAAVLPPGSSGLSGLITGESPLFPVFFGLVLTRSAVL